MTPPPLTTTPPPPTRPAPLRVARQPLATPTAVPIAVVLALLIGAAGVVCGRDALISWQIVGGTFWIRPLLDAGVSVHADTAWLAPTAIAVLIAGLALVVVALAPRRRTHRLLTAEGVWLRRRDVATLITDAGRALPGVDAIHIRGSLRRHTVVITPNVSAADDLPGLRNHAHAALTAALTPLTSPPKIAVTVQKAPRR